MTSRRGDRDGWSSFLRQHGGKPATPTQAENALVMAWHTPREKRTDEQHAIIAGDKPSRARPVQHESAEMAKLWRGVKARWWRPGWWRWEAATWDEREANRRSREGVRSSWPDCGLMLPHLCRHAVGEVSGEWVPGPEKPVWVADPIVATLELKAPAHLPKRAIAAEWWLESMGAQKSRHGLSREQSAVLQCHAAMGWRTMVAYSADEALEWFDSIAGPKPSVMPSEWDYWVDTQL